MNIAPQSPEADQVEFNVLSHIAHQLTVQGPAPLRPKLGGPVLYHGFIESISLDDLFGKVFGEDE